MPKSKDTLDRISIPKPCTADWDEMIGNEQVRFCSHCSLSVHNLSAMTRREALRLVTKSKGKLCARYIRRPDGEIQTSHPVLHQLQRARRRATHLAAGAFTAALSLSSSAVAAGAVVSTPAASNTVNHTATAFLRDSAPRRTSGASGASLAGIVKDQNDAMIAGANVTIINERDSISNTTSSNDEGFYIFQSLPEGSYTLKVESPGFNTKEISHIHLRANEERSLATTLDVGFISGDIVIREPSDPLVAAVYNGEVADVRRLLATGADVNALDTDYDSTALAVAVSKGYSRLVKILLNAGADVNAKNSSGQTALMSLSSETTARIIWELIDAGAKIDLQDNSKKTALIHAAEYADVKVVKALLDAGAPVDARDEDERTALMTAADAGNADNVSALLQAGATVNLRDEDGETALGLARDDDHDEVVKILESYGGVE
ncbi:MAG: ankyrin repeat domain-containing protein [Pyrinomonadaceae bacterium]|nr:ankyrin repeat domain-containing protein [Pyrinomonadaceae bacterium]